MLKRIIDISNPAYVCVEHRQLLFKHNGEIIGTAPIEDVGAVILQHPAITISQAAIIACQENNTIIVFCDKKYLPYSTIFSISSGHCIHTKILRTQTSITIPTQTRMWKQVVQHKIAQQINTLSVLKKSPSVLVQLKRTVKNGDTTNNEATAASKYWKMLMGDKFLRRQNIDDTNPLLNYGYAIMRAMMARALVATGLHPAIGIFHKNQYNGLCLADDMMEPLRPFVDRVVFRIINSGGDVSISRENKQKILGLLSTTMTYDGMQMSLMVTMQYIASNLKNAMTNRTIKLSFPEWNE